MDGWRLMVGLRYGGCGFRAGRGMLVCGGVEAGSVERRVAGGRAAVEEMARA